MKQRGSALLIAIFLVAAVGGVAFAIGRLFALETNLATIYENSTVAYYAAESGIEEGYLRYRFNKDTEIHADSADTKTNRSNLDNMVLNSTQLASVVPGSASVRFYDLWMKYKAPFYGADVDGDTFLTSADVRNAKYPKEYFIPRDESVKIDISEILKNNQTRDINLLVQFKNDTNDGSCSMVTNKPFIEAKFTGTTPFSAVNGHLGEWKIALTDENNKPAGFVAGSFLAVGKDVNNVLNYQNLMANTRLTLQSSLTPAMFTQNSEAELSLKPMVCSARIGIVPAGAATPVIASPFSTVKSTGHYGGITRTLEAKIDRQAGTVYDLFDYVMYQK